MSTLAERLRPAPRPGRRRGDIWLLAFAVAAALPVGIVFAALSARFGDAGPLILVAIPLVPLLALAALAYPPLAVIAVFASFPVGTRVLPGSVQLSEAAVLVALVLVALPRIALARTPLRFAAPLWWVVALLGWTLIALLSAVDAELALKQVLSLIGGLAFAVVVLSACRDLLDVRRVAGAFVLAGSAIALAAVAGAGELETSFGGADISGRAQGAFGSPNELGSFASMAGLVAAGLILGARTHRARLAAAVGLGALLVSLALSLSRGGWIAALVGGLVLLLTTRRARKVALVVGVPTLVAAAAIFVSVAGENPQLKVVGERVGSITVRSPYDDRPAIWREALREIRLDPWTGQGPGSFPVASVRAGSDVSTVSAFHAHNIVLTWAAEAGLPAALLLVGLMVSLGAAGATALRRASDRGDEGDRAVIAGIVAALVSVLAQGLVDYTLRNGVIFLAVWGLIGLLLAAREAERPRRARSSGRGAG